MAPRHQGSWGPWRKPVAVVACLAAVGFAGSALPGSRGAAAAAGAAGSTDSNPSFADRFRDPTSEALPFNRYWVPAGTAEPGDIAANIELMAENNIGGAEYNDLVLANGYDTSEYIFGTPAWTASAKTAIRAGIENDVQIDFLMTPNWSLSSPKVDPDSLGAAKTLVNGNVTVEGGQSLAGPVPVPAAALPAGVTKREFVAAVAVRCASSCSGPAPVLLDENSSRDVSHLVANGQISWTAPAGGQWKLFGFYFQGNGTRPVGNYPGSFVINHFDKAGADAVTGMWEERVLDDELRGMLRAQGASMFVDSLELGNQNWTPALPGEFEQRRGRSLIEGLPVLSLGDPAFDFEGDAGSRFRLEYASTLQELWVENHLAPLKDWTNELGMTLRYQTYSSDGETFVDPIASWTEIDVPEGEDWVFNRTAEGPLVTRGSDSFRSVGAAAAMAGKNIVSSECCAAFREFANDSYRVTWQQVLARVNHNLATGVNRIVYHGFPHRQGSSKLFYYLGQASWPGWSPFVPITGIAEPWDNRQPAWDHQADINTYIGRMQTVLQEGDLKSDVAVYRQGTNVGEVYFPDTGLEAAGYTYGFLSAPLLEGENAIVRKGRLAPGGPAYGALVLDNQQALSLNAASAMLRHVRAGLPLVVVGDAPTRVPGAATGDEALRKVITRLMAEPGVHRVGTRSQLPQLLKSIGVRPASEMVGTSSLISLRRATKKTDFYYMFNASESATTTTVALQGEGKPYLLDAWTGEIEPLAKYRTEKGRVVVDVTLPATGSTVIALTKGTFDGGRSSGVHVEVSDADSVAVDGGRLLVRNRTNEVTTTTLSNGRTLRTSFNGIPTVSRLNAWQLDVESWGPGPNDWTDAKTQLPRRDVTAGPDGRLPSWTDIPGLADVSGIGRYRSTLMLGKRWQGGHGAYLDLGAVFNTFAVTVNGQRLDPVDQLNPRRIDLGGFLKKGTNVIEVEVSTTLRNKVLTVPGQAGGSGTSRQNYGLFGPVELVPYGETHAR